MRWLAAAVAVVFLYMPDPADAAHRSACEQATGDAVGCSHLEVFGHRGRTWDDVTVTDENTEPAFAADLRTGASFESDGWVLADGRPVIFHDQYLCRVVDQATLPAGVTCRTPITDLVTSQFRQLRTKGGEPLWTVKHLIRWAGRHHVTGMIENKYQSLPPETLAYWIGHFHADVWLYQTPKCGHGHLLHPEAAAYGVRVGVKYHGGCTPSVEEMADAGFSFVIASMSVMAPAYVDEVHHYGLEIGNFNSGHEHAWIKLVQVGADYALMPHPGSGERWKS